MNRLTMLLVVIVASVFAVLSAPQFILSVLIGAAAIVFGLRWFIRSASRRGWRR
ncbi:hypothetical protein [Nocardia sp. NPDC056100]|uniref:hypothetical protein n=1 Tax=Nocardia sp. NPDC056100 TaxID=3345712 RepID=UPI0035D6ED00